MPRGTANVCHVFNQMSHVNLPKKAIAGQCHPQGQQPAAYNCVRENQPEWPIERRELREGVATVVADITGQNVVIDGLTKVRASNTTGQPTNIAPSTAPGIPPGGPTTNPIVAPTRAPPAALNAPLMAPAVEPMAQPIFWAWCCCSVVTERQRGHVFDIGSPP